jgi:hypothetical protein
MRLSFPGVHFWRPSDRRRRAMTRMAMFPSQTGSCDRRVSAAFGRSPKEPLFDTSARGNLRIDDRERKIRDFPTILKGRGRGQAFGWPMFLLERRDHPVGGVWHFHSRNTPQNERLGRNNQARGDEGEVVIDYTDANATIAGAKTRGNCSATRGRG